MCARPVTKEQLSPLIRESNERQGPTYDHQSTTRDFDHLLSE